MEMYQLLIETKWTEYRYEKNKLVVFILFPYSILMRKIENLEMK